MSDINVPIYVTNQFTQPGYSYIPPEEYMNYKDSGYNAMSSQPEYMNNKDSIGYNIMSSIEPEYGPDNQPLTNGEIITFTIGIFLMFTALAVILSYTV